jgi:retinol dehydrogenase 12
VSIGGFLGVYTGKGYLGALRSVCSSENAMDPALAASGFFVHAALPPFATAAIKLILHSYVLLVTCFRVSTHEAYLTDDPKMAVGCLVALLLAVAAMYMPGDTFVVGGSTLAGVFLLDIWAYYALVEGPKPKPTDLSGKISIVTGSNTGIGLETAKGLAEMGSHVVLACRSAGKAQAAVEDIIRRTGNRRVEAMVLDLSSLDSVRRFAKEFGARRDLGRLDLLVNNAGVMLPQRQESEDGIELTLQSNHVGHFLLTELLLPLLQQGGGRVVNVASALHRAAGFFDFSDIQQREETYTMFKAYRQSKLANLLFTMELDRRLEGSNVTVNCCHPGNVMTEVTRNLPAWVNFLHGRFIYYLEAPFIKKLENGAFTTLYVATSPEIEGQSGLYFVHCKTQRPAEAALDKGAAKKLWEATEAMCR